MACHYVLWFARQPSLDHGAALHDNGPVLDGEIHVAWTPLCSSSSSLARWRANDSDEIKSVKWSRRPHSWRGAWGVDDGAQVCSLSLHGEFVTFCSIKRAAYNRSLFRSAFGVVPAEPAPIRMIMLDQSPRLAGFCTLLPTKGKSSSKQTLLCMLQPTPHAGLR